MHENAHANAAEEDKNSKFTEKIKTISNFVKEQIQTKNDSKPKAMNEKEEKPKKIKAKKAPLTIDNKT